MPASEIPEIVLLGYWVPRGQIHYLRFLLEGYDGLLTLRGAPGSCRVTFEIPKRRMDEARALIEALEGELGLRPASQGGGLPEAG